MQALGSLLQKGESLYIAVLGVQARRYVFRIRVQGRQLDLDRDPFESMTLLHIRPDGANPSPRHVRDHVEATARSDQVKSSQVRPCQIKSGRGQVEVRSRQVRSGQVKLGQVRSGQVRSGQVRLGQVMSGYVGGGGVWGL